MSGVNIKSPADRLSEALAGLKLDSSATSSGALFQKKGADLRRTIVTIYKNHYALRGEPWYNHLYSHMACYIRDAYPGQYPHYAPVLDTYPMTGVEMAFQPNLLGNNYLFDDKFIYDWAASKYWCDPSEHTLRSGVHFVMTGGGTHAEYMKQYGGSGQAGGAGTKIGISKPAAKMAENLSQGFALKALQETARQSQQGYQFPSLINYLGSSGASLRSMDPFGQQRKSTYLEAALGAPKQDSGYIVDRAQTYDNNGKNVIYDYVRQTEGRAKHVFSENPHLDIVDDAKLALRRRFSSGEMSGDAISKSVEQLYELVRSTRQGGGLHKHIYRSVGADSHLLDLYKDVAIWLEEERLQKHIGIDQYEIWSNALLGGYRDMMINAKATLEPKKFEALIKWLTESGGKARMHDALKAAYSDVVAGHSNLQQGVERAARVAREALKKIDKGEALEGGARRKPTKKRSSSKLKAKNPANQALVDKGKKRSSSKKTKSTAAIKPRSKRPKSRSSSKKRKPASKPKKA